MSGNVDRAYDAIREMAVEFRLKPGERLNESQLALQLEVSRTPLREALNRLSTEGFLMRDGKRGFRCRALDTGQVFDLYEFRCEIEVAAVALACERAEDAALCALEDMCETDVAILDRLPQAQLLDRDEAFHEALMQAGGNAEMLHALRNLNARIRFVRGMERAGRHARSETEHLEIVRALRRRDVEEVRRRMRAHIARRRDEILDAIRRSYSRIYMGDADDMRADPRR